MNYRLQPEPTSIPRLALRPREAAKALGISERTLWQLTKDGKIPCVRIGEGKRQSVRYPVHLLEAWLKQKAKAQAECLDVHDAPHPQSSADGLDLIVGDGDAEVNHG